MNSIFEEASKQKLRFDTPKGQLSVENLWDLSLADLNTIAVSANRSIRENSEESFISTTTKVPKKLQLQFDILKAIIDRKLADIEKARRSAERKQKRDKLLEALSNKQDAKINSMSIKALEAELDKLDDDDSDEE